MSLYAPRDTIGGGVLVAAGLFVSSYAYATMPLGTVARMGPGFMPFVLGFLLAGLGLFIALGSLKDRMPLPVFNWRAFLAVVGAILAFSFLARPLGMVPAVAAVLILASLAEMKITKWQFIALVIALPSVAYLTFSVGLGVPLPLFKWPF